MPSCLYPLRSLLIVVVTVVLATSVRADDWPHWRGTNRNGNVSESSHFRGGDWPPGKPLWTTNVNSGGSGPIVIGNRLYTMGWKDDRDTIYALDTATGKVVWQQSYPCPEYGRVSEGDKGLYSGPSSCPSYDAKTGYLYTLSTDGDLICWNTRQQGKRVWGINFYDLYQVPQRPKVGRRKLRDYGYTTAPLLQGETVIAEVGGRRRQLDGLFQADWQTALDVTIQRPGRTYGWCCSDDCGWLALRRRPDDS